MMINYYYDDDQLLLHIDNVLRTWIHIIFTGYPNPTGSR